MTCPPVRRANLAGVDGVELVEGSILDAALLDEVFDGADAIVHLAARPSVPRSLEDPMASHQANATGTMEVLEAARRHGRPQVVVASSSSVYGANPALPKREDMVAMPVSPYAASKLAAESLRPGLRAVVRPAGAGLPLLQRVRAAAGGRPRLCRRGAGLRGRRPARRAPPRARRRPPDPRLHLRGHRGRGADRRRPPAVTVPGPVNLAFGTRVSLLDSSSSSNAARGTGRSPPLRPPPGDVRDSQADQSALRRLFPDVEPVALERGIRSTLEWFRSGS